MIDEKFIFKNIDNKKRINIEHTSLAPPCAVRSSGVAEVSWAPFVSRPPTSKVKDGGHHPQGPNKRDTKAQHHTQQRNNTTDNTQQHTTRSRHSHPPISTAVRVAVHTIPPVSCLSSVVFCLLSLFLFCLPCLVSVVRASCLHVRLSVCLSLSVFFSGCHRDLENFGV